MAERTRHQAILIDGRNMLWRVAMKMALTAEIPGEGEVPTGGIYGFIKTCLSIWEHWADAETATLVVCWDGGYAHRTALYPAYKSNRAKRDLPVDVQEYMDTLDDQEKVLRAVLRTAGWPQARASGYEADDVMATLAERFKAAGRTPVAIYTADQDLHQCVGNGIVVIAPPPTTGTDRKERLYDMDAVLEKHGVAPHQVPCLKGLAGDAGDCIPGVPGVGPGWGSKLLQQYGNLGKVLRAAATGTVSGVDDDGKPWSSPSKAKAINDNAALARLSRELALVVRDAPVSYLPREQDQIKLQAALTRFQMRTLLAPNAMADILDIGSRATA